MADGSNRTTIAALLNIDGIEAAHTVGLVFRRFYTRRKNAHDSCLACHDSCLVCHDSC